jgi:hypothetical protein
MAMNCSKGGYGSCVSVTCCPSSSSDQAMIDDVGSDIAECGSDDDRCMLHVRDAIEVTIEKEETVRDDNHDEYEYDDDDYESGCCCPCGCCLLCGCCRRCCDRACAECCYGESRFSKYPACKFCGKYACRACLCGLGLAAIPTCALCDCSWCLIRSATKLRNKSKAETLEPFRPPLFCAHTCVLSHEGEMAECYEWCNFCGCLEDDFRASMGRTCLSFLLSEGENVT